jgi:hypothetical protein
MDSKLYRNSFFTNNTLILITASVSLIVACLINTQTKKPVISISKQESAININTKFLSVLSGGHKRLITDLLWIQTLIESDTEHYKKKDLNSWLFLRFMTISVLDPKFYENYLYGGQFLSIMKDDLEGASYIFDKGLTHYQDDYDLNYNAGFLYYFEMGDYERGLKNIEKIQYHSRAPSFFPSVVNKLKIETGVLDLKTILSVVLAQYLSTHDENLKLKFKSDLYAIKAEIDLKCLNSGNENCDRLDSENRNYILSNGKYHSQKSFTPYRLKKRGERSSPQKSTTTF